MFSRIVRLARNRTSPAGQRERGQSLVELALVLPLLLLLVLGIWELGRVYDAVVIITNASREGARIAARGSDADDVRQRVQDYLTLGYGERISANGDIVFDPSDVQVDGIGSPKGDPVTVAVPAQVKIFVPVLSGIANPVGITGRATMRIE